MEHSLIKGGAILCQSLQEAKFIVQLLTNSKYLTSFERGAGFKIKTPIDTDDDITIEYHTKIANARSVRLAIQLEVVEQNTVPEYKLLLALKD